MKYVYIGKIKYMSDEEMIGVFKTKEDAEKALKIYRITETSETMLWVEKWEIGKEGDSGLIDVCYLDNEKNKDDEYGLLKIDTTYIDKITIWYQVEDIVFENISYEPFFKEFYEFLRNDNMYYDYDERTTYIHEYEALDFFMNQYSLELLTDDEIQKRIINYLDDYFNKQ